MDEDDRYLKEGRLADVLSMMQLLGLDPQNTWVSDAYLIQEGGKPRSAQAWKDIATDHPEFFRYHDAPDIKEPFSLMARHAMADPATKQLRPLAPSFLGELFRAAIALDERQLKQKHQYYYIVSAALSIVGSVVGALVGAFLGAKHL